MPPPDPPHPELQARIGAILGRRPRWFRWVEGGYTPAGRWLVGTAAGSFFVKVGRTPVTARMLRREIRAYQALSGPFMPRCLGWDDSEVEPLLVLEDLSAAFWPPPWDGERVAAVRDQIAALHGSAASLPVFAEVHGHWEGGWQLVARDPAPFLSLSMASAAWLRRALPELVAAERQCETYGQAPGHVDIRSDNICFAADGVKLVDWAEACLMNPKLDLGFWLPSLAFEGGPLPETILPHEPAIAAWVAGFLAARAGLPLIPDAPRVRRVQREQLETALPWARRALGL